MANFGPENTKKFAVRLLKWNKEVNTRKMPWKGEKDPYKIWLSEIILQQTRVEQGWEYYNRFIAAFPAIKDLAQAKESTVYKMWEGLGYYSRCRNLIATAKSIVKEKKAQFPGTYDEILKLKGIGPYTAAAIASFAYNLPYAVLDGNVYRVLARIYGIDIPIDTNEGKKYFAALSHALLDKNKPGVYNQAIMDFGAVVCKPQAPLCPGCPFQKDCVAYNKGLINSLPAKSKKKVTRTRWFYYLVLSYQNRYLVHLRSQKDIWQHLYEFTLVEASTSLPIPRVLTLAEKHGLPVKSDYELLASSGEIQQQLSHQKIKGRFIRILLKKAPVIPPGSKLVTETGLKKLAFPRFINNYLETRDT